VPLGQGLVALFSFDPSSKTGFGRSATPSRPANLPLRPAQHFVAAGRLRILRPTSTCRA